jgi:phosphoglycerol transferase MdoB-like AlkP superfamily enzyme
MKDFFRFKEYKILAYRIILAYLFYFIARILFYLYNVDLLHVSSLSEFLKIYYYGIAFDTTAILYINALFIVLSILPFGINTDKNYQKFLFYIYFIFNLIAYSTNFIDFIYYKYNFSRSTWAVLDTLENETNKSNMFFRFIISYWHVYLLFILLAFLWVFLYKKVKLAQLIYPKNKLNYFISSIVGFLIIGILMIGGIRGGDFKKSTRPINLVDANRHVTKPEQADLVLNTPFAIIRTINKNSFKKKKYNISELKINSYFQPIKQYVNTRQKKTKPNIVLIITESLGREYLGAFNKDMDIENYVSYTPFLDSLAAHSLIYTNAFANGRKSIHGMSSILAGIPSFTDAFTSSPYAKQKIQSLVSCVEEIGYTTSFFHGAANGSMGFLGFGNILGLDEYYGRTEFNNDKEFDGFWGIWDEPFLQYMKEELDQKKTPFFSTVFTLSSHEPYIVPDKYDGEFPKGNVPMHQCVGYTDYAFKKFFNAAKKEAWFENTIFIITADHGNQVYYKKEYHKVMNRNTVPILFYTPDESLKGVSKDLAQQIDIYPTILDMVGYDKSFRSWGRSLIGDKEIKPFAMNHSGVQYQLQRGNYICTFDGNKTIGFFDINDKGLEHNLIHQRNKEMDTIEEVCKAFLQDYYERIVDRKLYAE